MLIIYIIVIGTVVGIIPSLFKTSKRTGLNIILGVLGAFVGAFLSFGDSPLLLKYNLGVWSIMIVVSILFVLTSVLIEKRRK